MGRKLTRSFGFTRYFGILILFFLVGCAIKQEIKVKPENIPYVFLNIALDKIEKFADKGSRGFPAIKKEIVSIGKFKLYSSLRLGIDRSNDKERNYDKEYYLRSNHRFETNNKLRIDKDLIYIEISFKF